MQSNHSRENSGPFPSAVHTNGQPSQRTGPFVHPSGSRSNSQNDYHHLSNPYQTPQSDLPPLNLPPATTMGLPPNGASPQYPTTPASTCSPYNFFNTHSRSNSNSNSNPRSTSPALSVASALTSVSSSAGPANGQGQMNPAPAVRKHKKQRLFNVDRKEICLYHKENPTARQEDIAIKYGVERSTISKILKHKQKWMNVPTEEEFKVAKHRPSKFPEIESQLVDWLSTTAVPQNITLSDSLIRNKARDIAKVLRISEDKFKASSGWVENFKHRHGIRRGVWHGDGKASKLSATGGPGPSSGSNLPANDSSNEDRGAVLPSFNTSFSNRRDSHFMNDRLSNTLSPLREVQIDHNQEDYRGHMRSPLSLPPPWSTSDRSPIHETSSSRNASDQSYSQSDTTSTSISAMSLSSLKAGWDSQSPVHPLPPPLHPSAYDSSHGQSNQDCSDPNVHPIQSHMGGGMYPLTSLPPRPESVPGRFTVQPSYPPLAISPSPLYRHSEPVLVNEAEDACDKIKYALFHAVTGVPREAKR
ncbi:hypothetical protein BDM02DRAFT_1753089 [Thelephora ganbajun]|uniref:Uncharacterized protein n=1 Tax=Thelephora ganbajun TaxID=370292 RepID=A0ACB6ZJS0_THEGA|nr:hypothetical protein BDM02DRAFT_1753089 [Thelephora ganbajun]